jgi:hypothetical protein
MGRWGCFTAVSLTSFVAPQCQLLMVLVVQQEFWLSLATAGLVSWHVLLGWPRHVTHLLLLQEELLLSVCIALAVCNLLSGLTQETSQVRDIVGAGG